MNRTMSTRLFHALFCVTRCTFRGQVACKAGRSFDRKVASLSTTNPWQQWLDVRLIAHEGHMGEAGPLLHLRCLLVWLLREKLPTSLEQMHRAFSRLVRRGCLPRSTRAAKLSYHCHTAWACFLVSGTQKATPFLVSESELKNGLAFWAPCEIPYLRLRFAKRRDRFWLRNLNPKTVSLSGPRKPKPGAI